MSFILEALKKSENKRRKTTSPGPRTIHEPLSQSRGRKRSWPLWLLVIAVNVLLLVWFLGPWQKTQLQPSEQAVHSLPVPPKRQRPPVPELLSVLVPQPKPVEVAGQEPTATQAQPRKAKEKELLGEAGAGEREPVRSKEQKTANPLPVPKNENHIYRLAELPLAVRQQLPALQMSLHAYNRESASASLVQLNNRIVREGDEVGSNLRLERITDDGVVLSYDGYRFLFPRKGE